MRVHFLTLVRLETAHGMVGWGECTTRAAEASAATEAIITEGFGPLILGRHPADVEAIWRALKRHSYWYGGGGIALIAMSGIDVALWDLQGQIEHVPIYTLLGGRRAEPVRAAASVLFDMSDIDGTCARFADYQRRGFTAAKGGYGVSPDAHFGQDGDRDLTLLREIRATVGDRMDIAADVSVHASWTLPHALKMGRRFEEFALFWLEDPLPHDNRVGYRRLRGSVTTPVATGERLWTLDDYRVLLDADAADIILIDPGRVGGITAMKRIADYAATQGVGVVPHSWFSALNTAAALHVFATLDNGVVFEIKPDPFPMQHELIFNPFAQVDGWLAVPDQPGLGINMNEAAVTRYTAR